MDAIVCNPGNTLPTGAHQIEVAASGATAQNVVALCHWLKMMVNSNSASNPAQG